MVKVPVNVSSGSWCNSTESIELIWLIVKVAVICKNRMDAEIVPVTSNSKKYPK
jgi:hypothetical protein